jgi:hypothetical protein
VERVDLEGVLHAERHRWRSGGEWDEQAPKIAVGQLADGRWYVRRYAGPVRSWPRTSACAYAGRHAEGYARRTARCWMRTLGGKWVEA